MAKEKKITIKYFLNKKVKARVYGEHHHYALYMRIIFDRKSTEVKVLDILERPIWISEDTFSTYVINKERALSMRMPPIPDKEIILERAIREEYKQKGDEFNFKPLISKFRIYEKYLYVLFEQSLIQTLKYNLEGLIGYADFGYIFSSPHVSNVYANYCELYVKEKVKIPLSESLQKVLACYVFLYNYTNKHENRFPPENTSVGIFPTPHILGSVYAWQFDGDSTGFKQYVEDAIKRYGFRTDTDGGIRTTIRVFEIEPKIEDVKEYIAMINYLVDRLKG